MSRMSTVEVPTLAGTRADATHLIVLAEVGKQFTSSRQDTEALAQTSLRVQAGEFVSIVGPSGCGKSTLLNIIAGLLKPDAGEVMFGGASIQGPGPDRVVVFQEPALFPWLDVAQNIEFGLKLRGVGKDVRRVAVDWHLQLVRLGKFQHAYPHELSGGMKQRVQIARALAAQPKALLMDEPFAALDAHARDELQVELQRIWASTGSTILFVTHNLREAVTLGDRVLVMSAAPGRIIQEVKVPLPRFRNPNDPEVAVFAAEIRAAIRQDFEAGTPEIRRSSSD